MDRAKRSCFCRRFGFSLACWSLALAALMECWWGPFVAGLFLMGVGIGMGGGDAR